MRIRSILAVLTAGVVMTGLVVAAPPALAEDPAARVITLAGSLQSELGCAGDWQPACDESELTMVAPGSYAARFALPAGAYEFKVTVNGSWDENYGADGARDGANIPLVIAGPARLDFAYDDTTHRVSITPTDLPGPATGNDRALAGNSLPQPLTREQFYFVMTDRFANGSTANDQGGLTGGRLVTGFDPTHKGFYHGGDLKGLISKLDYIKGLGTTSIWLTPSFVNKPVQGPPGQETAGYHGYWITDFTHIDPHLGTNADMRALVDAAHAKGMKLFFDVITNHTADVIDYAQKQYSYISKSAVPYKDANGSPFDDRDYVNQTFPPMNASSFPYTPVFDKPSDATAKTPAWLNDITLYHNRGDSTYAGESATYGDFSGLDDLFTERPDVLHGMEDIYKAWVDMGIDGFRIDTAKHVNTEFWQQFSPAMLDEAHRIGTKKFFMFGEVFDADPAFQSIYSTTAKLPATLDFGFQQNAVAVANGGATTYLSKLYAGDDYYTDTDSNAYDLPTFLGNHDMGRIGRFVGGSLARDQFAHALMYTLRGQPVVYYGDEQGFTGDGGDQDARQDMFPSQVASYNDDDLIGTDATTAQENFDPQHPLYRAIADLADLRARFKALRDGTQQHRLASDGPGIYAFSRMDRAGRREFVVALNNAEQAQTAAIPTYAAGASFRRVYGSGTARVVTGDDRTLPVTVQPLSAVVYRAARRLPRSTEAPSITLQQPGPLRDRAEIRADVGGSDFAEVTFYVRDARGRWTPIGTDDNAPYRVFHDVSDVAPGTSLHYVAVVQDDAGHARRSQDRAAQVAPPLFAWEAPEDGARVRGEVELRAVATPDKPSYVASFERQVGDEPFRTVGTDRSSPVYTAFDDTSDLPDGTVVRYRATLFDADGLAIAETEPRSVVVVAAPVTTAIVHYNRPAGDYDDWGLHLFGAALPAEVATDWLAPRQRDGVDEFGAFFEIPIADDTKPVGFIVHKPGGDQVPETRDTAGDRSFVPLAHPEIWLRQGDPTIYFNPPA